MLVSDQFETKDGVLTAYLGDGPYLAVPEGVHTIGKGVFKGMSWLLGVKLPKSLKKIDDMAFKGCRQLSEINFPDGLEEIGEYAFHRCHRLESLVFPDSVTVVGSCAFLYCDSLKKAVLKGPKRLNKACFSHDIMLNEIALNEDVDASNFSDEVFEGCIHIKKITLSGKSYEIGNLMDVLKPGVNYPETVIKIARGVYHAMQIEDGVLSSFSVNLKSVILPEGIRAIGKGCFFDKKGITSITLPESVSEIRANAFLNCQSLEEIVIKNNKILLDDRAFRGCCNLKRVVLAGKSHELSEIADNELVGRIRDQVTGDFYISGRILVRYMGNEEQIAIPKEVEIIGERCFFGNERLKTVICPEALSEIREQAFEGCVALQNIVLSPQLKRVEREAFAECRKLLKCNLPGELEHIGEYAFRRCLSLRKFDPYPEKAEIHPFAFFRAGQLEEKKEDVERRSGDSMPCNIRDKSGIRVLKLTDTDRIGKYEYAFSPDLEEVVIDAPDCVVAGNAFSNCPNLKRVSLNVRSIERAAFSYCRKLESVKLTGITSLPAECFAGCYSLTSFDAGIAGCIGERCFDECIKLKSFDFSHVSEIGDRAFERCDLLEKLVLGKIRVGYHAFADCAGLKSVCISVDTILKSGAFIGCTGIRSVVFDGMRYEISNFSDSLNYTGNPYPLQVRELAASVYSCFEIAERRILTGYLTDAAKLTIPEDIEEIGPDAFRDHVRLGEINIPASVRIFGSHAFSMTEWLDKQRKENGMVTVNDVLIDGAMCKGEITIPPSVKRIASWCFAGNTEITGLTMMNERLVIENLAFRNCLLLRKIKDAGGNEYVLENISDLKDKDYPELIERIFTECINCFKLDENGRLIESTGNIKNLTFPEGIRSIGDGVYKDCHLLENIVLSSDTAEIGKSAFENSRWLRSVRNAAAVKKIGSMAFSACQSLEKIDLSDSLTELGSRCFEHCAGLKEIYLSDKLELIPERAFFRCKSLKKLVIPDSVKAIEKEAFAFCDMLEEVYVSEKTEIGERAFAYCEKARMIRRK